MNDDERAMLMMMDICEGVIANILELEELSKDTGTNKDKIIELTDKTIKAILESKDCDCCSNCE